MRFDVLTLFPGTITEVVTTSILKRAQLAEHITVVAHDIRSVTTDTHHVVDDTPYGGGSGMLMKVDILHKALTQVLQQPEVASISPEKRRIILITPAQKVFTQKVAEEYANQYEQITLMCGHYEGFDARILKYVDEELSIGPFVLTGGELPALTVIDAVSRLVPGVLGDSYSHVEESYSLQDESGKALLEYPQYTRPLEYDGQKVPDALLSGHHAEIKKWRLSQAKLRTNAE